MHVRHHRVARRRHAVHPDRRRLLLAVRTAGEFRQARRDGVVGFELLEGDHELIHHRIEAVIKSANKLFGQLQTKDRDAIRRAADSFAGVSDTLISGLMRHLDDEEDLIVPVILDRGERKLGLS